MSQVGDQKKHREALCFNYTESNRKASACRRRSSCKMCGQRHHSSICDSGGKSQEPQAKEREHIFVTTVAGKVQCSVVVAGVNGIKCRAKLDTGTGSSYASSVLLENINTKPTGKENKQTVIHKVTICSLENDFKINTEVTKVERDKLFTLENQQYQEKINQDAELKAG